MIHADAVIVLQARMASHRLPGKALVRLGGDTLLGHCLRRLTCAGVAPVVLATTVGSDDDPLVAEAARFGVRTVRGPREDVLRRFAQVVRETGATFVVRATADNPAVDLHAAGRVLRALRIRALDYCGERNLPVGSGVEAVRGDALLDAAAHAVEPYDREHVTPFIKFNSLRYRVRVLEAPRAVRRPDLRLTVDTPADLEYLQQVLEAASRGTGPAPLADIIAASDTLAARARVA
ncbi:MAG TPA: NTP transferase domain-containing protein [Vicinamibacterales bacterium]|nr:NTP transferase domain-containing protein [Vicinamibacterales bacterium]